MNGTTLTANSLTGRTHYKSSGAVNVGAFALWTLLGLVVAGLLAAGMFWLYHVGYYYIILVPFICALAVAGMARLAVGRGHCRNGLVGALMGALLGLSLYLGSYYIGIVYYLGPEVAGRPDVLVQYIRFRLATDVVSDAHEPKDNLQRETRRSSARGMNWFRFALESIGVLAIVTAAAYRRARKPYCEQCWRWLEREITSFEPQKAAELIQTLQTGSARALAALCATPPFTTIPNTTLAVEYCPSLKEGRTRDCPVYVSLKSVVAGPKGATLDAFEQSKGKLLERCVQLTPDEVPALAPRFPTFEAYAGWAAVASLLPRQEPVSWQEAPESQPHGELAEIIPLGSEHHGKVLTRRMIWLGNGIGFAGLAGFIGGLALLAWGAGILEGSATTSMSQEAGIVICVIGGVLVLAAVAGFLFDSSFGANRMLRKAFKAALARRAGVLVEPDDPEALFVEVVPKLNWGKTMLENASDIGLLAVDRARREIRFEGDNERWRVPARSITRCEMESFVRGQGAGASATRIYFVVLRANRRDGSWEAPVRLRRGTGVLSRRKKSAVQLVAAIQAIREPAGIRADELSCQ